MKNKIDFSKIKDGSDYLFFFGGNWHKSKSNQTIPINNPFNNKLVGNIQACTKSEVDEIIDIARKNINCWNNFTQRERAEILHKAGNIIDNCAEEIGFILMNEIGKPLKSAISEINRTADIFHATAEAGIQISGETIIGDSVKGGSKSKISLTTRVPLGVILCIGPFNYPFNLTGSKIAPGLMAGNTIIMKSSTQGAITASHFGVILEEAGVPPGVFNFVTGRGSEIGDYIVQHSGIDMVSFTGSSETGRRIALKAGMKPLLMELGGKDAAIVLKDANLDKTVDSIVSGAFSYSGQRCTAVKRVLPMPEIADLLINKVTEKVKDLSVGDPAKSKSIGPLINSKQCDYIQDLIDDAIQQGANIKCGNKREGNILWPTVIDNVTTKMRIAWEEPFGPVLPFIRINSIEEAITISNNSEYGLQGMIFTENIDLAFNIANELEVGTVQINGKSARGPDHFPFLGTKSSGLGTQGIKYSIEGMSRPKVIVMNLSEKGKLISACKDDD